LNSLQTKLLIIFFFGLQLLPSKVKADELQSHSEAGATLKPGASDEVLPTTQTSKPATSTENETPQEESEPSIDEIFEKTFKKKRSTQSKEIILSISDGNRNFGTIKSWIGPNPKDVKVEFSRLLTILSAIIDETHLAKNILQEKAVAQDSTNGLKTIQLSDFQNIPYSIEFEASTLELRLKIPSEIRLAQTTSLYQNILTEGGTAIKPNRFSTYTNFLLDQELLTGTELNNQNSRQPFRGRFESVFNVDGWVLESNNTYIENQSDMPQKTFIRGDLRLIKDYPKWLLRQNLGDLRYMIKGYQAYIPMAGISLTSNYLLLSSFLTVTSGSYDLILKRPSKVTIFVNDHERQTLDLPAGKFDIRDITLNLDQNKVRIEIVDDLGQKEVVNLSFYFHSDLLKTGIHQVSYAFGYPLINLESGERTYDTHRPTLSFFHRYGLMQAITIGANAQKDFSSSLIGFEALFGTDIGFFRIEPAFSLSPEKTTGFATNLSFQPTIQQDSNLGYRYLYFSLNAISPYFRGFSNYYYDSLTAYDFSASYAQALSSDLHLNLNTKYQFNRKSNSTIQDSYSIGIGLAKRLSNNISLSTTLTQRKLRTGAHDASISFFFRWNLEKQNQSVTAAYNPNGDNFRATWSKNSRSGQLNAVNLQAGLDRSSDRRGFNGTIQYSGQRGYASLFHRSTWSDSIITGSESLTGYNARATSLTQNTSAQIGFSALYAGGHLGISRPISDSFVMFNTVKNTRGQQLEINPKKDGTYLASNDWISPAVVPDVPSYQENHLTLGTSKFDPGILIDQDHFKLQPTYRSGYSIEIGTDATIRISVKLLNEDNTPIVHEPGGIHSLSDPTMEPLVFFTGRKGQITVDRLKPGKYELKMYKETLESIQFEILPDSEMTINLGQFIIKKR